MIKLSAVGDVMLGDFPLTIGFGVKSSLRKNPDVDIFRGVSEFLKSSDIIFGNLECVLSDDGLDPKKIKSIQMRADPSCVKMLSAAGFNIMSIANNHMMQHGLKAFQETKETLEAYGINPIGHLDKTGRSFPQFLEIKGIRLCFLAYSFRKEKYHPQVLYAQGDQNTILEDIRRIKNQSDIIVISLHWGDEFVDTPSPEQIKLAHRFIDEGVSIIIGHHPHMLQGIETYGRGIIAYSLGNFIFDFWQKRFRKTIILQIDFDKNGIQKIDIIPLYINKYFQPEYVAGIYGEKNKKCITLLSDKIKTINTNNNNLLNKYHQNVKRNEFYNKLENRFYFVKNIYKYDLKIIFQSLIEFIKSRIKLL